MRRLLLLTLPACLVVGWLAARTVRETGGRVADDVVATFPLDSISVVTLPGAGEYRAIGIGSREAVQRVEGWTITVRPVDGGKGVGSVRRATSRRASARENQPGLDLLFAVQVPHGGRWALQATGEDLRPGTVTVRLTRVNQATAGLAMRAFGLATLFSILLLVSAILYFRR